MADWLDVRCQYTVLEYFLLDYIGWATGLLWDVVLSVSLMVSPLSLTVPLAVSPTVSPTVSLTVSPPSVSHRVSRTVPPRALLVHSRCAQRRPPPCALHLPVAPCVDLVHSGSSHVLPPPCAMQNDVVPTADLLHCGCEQRFPATPSHHTFGVVQRRPGRFHKPNFDCEWNGGRRGCGWCMASCDA